MFRGASVVWVWGWLGLSAAGLAVGCAAAPDRQEPTFAAVRLAVMDTMATFGPAYPEGPEHLRRLDELERAGAGEQLPGLARRVLLANPLLDFDRLLVVKRDALDGDDDGGEIAILSDLRGAGRLQTVYRPPGRQAVADLELHFDAGRVLFSMTDRHGAWGVYEIDVDPSAGARSAGRPLRRLTPARRDAAFRDACYGPAGQVYLAGSAAVRHLPCRSRPGRAGHLVRMDPATRRTRQVTFDRGTDRCPTMMPDGRVLYLRQEAAAEPGGVGGVLMTMNPDGTGQAACRQGGAGAPGGLLDARPIPGSGGKVVGILAEAGSGGRFGRLVILDLSAGRQPNRGAVREIPHAGPRVARPYPLSEKYHLVSMQPRAGAPWGIYLVDVFGNVTPIRAPAGSSLPEAQPLRGRPRPAVVPDRVDPRRKDALVYVADVYDGPGLAGVPRGQVKELRVLAHPRTGGEGRRDVRRILGTVPVETDGSAWFRVPANTPISLQCLDGKGRALQRMDRSMVAMPGETVSCVGCHAERRDSAPSRRAPGRALAGRPAEIADWFGPPRGFGFRREVQPVLDKYCLACHSGDNKLLPNFLDEGGGGLSTPYRNLQMYVRRAEVGPRRRPAPLEYHAGTSELIQMFQKGHNNVQLDREAWQRLYGWIDLNAPYYGTDCRRDRSPNPAGADQRKRTRRLADLYASLQADCDLPPRRPKSIIPRLLLPWPRQEITLGGWPFDAAEARRRQVAALRQVSGPAAKSPRRAIDLGGGVTLALVLLPAGGFVMGDDEGELDERPQGKVQIAKPFWMGAVEVTAAQFGRFDASRGSAGRGPRRPVTGVSWQEAVAFCRWLGKRTGQTVSLPTEAQWEYACRAGTGTALSYGPAHEDFSRHANVADAAARAAFGKARGGGLASFPTDGEYSDGQPTVCDVGRYAPNAWGLHDLHGNVAEWTRSAYRPYPTRGADGRNDAAATGRRVVRGGSWRDRPKRCRSAFRLAYEPYQRVTDVGFRVVMECR